MSELSLSKQLAETSTMLITKMSGLQGEIDEVRKKLGDGTSAENKQEFNKMAEAHAKLAEEVTTIQSTGAKRMEEIEKELQEQRQKQFTWNASSKIANPYTGVYKHLLSVEDVSDLDVKNASESQIRKGLDSYGTKIAHTDSMFANIAFPDLMRQKALLTSTVTPGSGAAGALMTPEYQEQILAPAQEVNSILDVFPMMMVDYEKLIWRKEILTRRRGSAGVSIQSLDFSGDGQGTAGTEVEFEFEMHEEEMRTFLGIAFASIQILQDVSYMQAYIGNQLEYEAVRDLVHNVLYGTNKTGNSQDQARQLASLDSESTDFDTGLIGTLGVSGAHYIDVLKAAWLQANLTFIPPTHHLMHPTDYTAMCLTKDNDGRYQFVPNINDETMLSPFGMPIRTSTYITQDKFNTIPANQTMVAIRKAWESGMSYEDNTNFRELIVTFRVWGRFGFIMFRPSSQIKGNFSSSFNA